MIARLLKNLNLLSVNTANRKRRHSKTDWLTFENLERRQMLTTITVTNLDASGPGSLRDALEQANSSPDSAETIVFEDSLAGGTINLGGDQLGISSNVTINGNGDITIDAQGQSRVFEIADGNSSVNRNVVLDGLNITNGSSDVAGGNIITSENLTVINSNVTGGNSSYLGGGIAVINGATQIVNSSVDGNQAQLGGGIGVLTESKYNTSATAVVTVSNSTVTNNNAERSGGGIHAQGGNTDVVLDNASVMDNKSEVDGGGVSNDGADVTLLEQTNVDGNEALTGGGLFGLNAVFNLQNSTISNNISGGTGGFSEGNGGGVALFQQAFFNAFNLIQFGNSAANDGGAIAATYGSEVNITSEPSESSSFVLGPQEGPAGNQFFDNAAADDGGAIFVDATSTISIEDAEFVNNSAENDGGAINIVQEIINAGAIENIFIDNTTFQSNNARQGGAVFLGENRTVNITNSLFGSNTSVAEGGAIFASSDFNNVGDLEFLSIADSTFRMNQSTGAGSSSDGGALAIFAGQVVDIANTAFELNSADNEGGAVFLAQATLECDQCTFDQNLAGSYGGAINVENTSTVTIARSTLSSNDAQSAGGINSEGSTNVIIDATTIANNTDDFSAGGLRIGDNLTLTNSSVTGNSSSGFGTGGLYIRGLSSDATIVNSTFAGNQGEDAGGIRVGSFADNIFIGSSTIADNTSNSDGGGIQLSANASAIVTLENSIVSNNTAMFGGNDLSGDFQVDFSLIEDVAGATLNGAGNITGVDPLLDSLADNGGPTQTQLLMAGSPAIDTGDPDAVAGQNGISDFDQRGTGFDRVVGGRIDIGATEVQVDVPSAPSVESIVLQDGTEQRSVIREITVTFDSIVNVADGAFGLTNEAGQAVDITAALSQVDNQTVAVLTFNGALTDSTGSLIDGNYSLRIIDDLITDEMGNSADSDGDGTSGNDRLDEFFRLYGDADGDGNVGFFDYALFRNALFSHDGDDDFNIAFDANGDGVIDLLDIQDFRDNFGASI